jgi:uncharacterized protein YhaN
VKILELCLRAFGAFSDFTLDLSGGEQGFHLLYGPNEAGKSTTRRALLGLFYGIPHNSADDFRHGKQDLRIAARLRRADGAEFAFTRRKGNKNTLLHFDNDDPLPDETELTRCLGGVEPEFFKTLFCLDHAELVNGGASILEGKGAVGEALFSAGLGGSNLRAVLRELDAEAEKLFKRQGQNQLISAGLRQFREVREKLRAATHTAADWQKFDQEKSQAQARREQLTARRDALRNERERLDRLGKALPALAKRRALLAQLAPLGDLPPLPESFSRDRAAAVADLKSAAAEEERTSTELKTLETRLGVLEVRADALAQSGAISALQQGVGSFREDSTDLPRLRGELTQLEHVAAGLLAELRPGLPMDAAETLRLSVLQREAIRRLAARHPALLAAEAAARETLEKLDTYLAARRTALHDLPPAPDIIVLTALVRRVQKRGDLEAALAQARRDQTAAEDTAARLLDSMPPPRPPEKKDADFAHGEAFAWLPMPLEESLSRFEREFTAAENRLSQREQEAERCERETADSQRELEALRLAGDPPTEEDLKKVRDWRTWGWQLVRDAWEVHSSEPVSDHGGFVAEGASLADAYAESVAAADDLVDRLRREADRVTKLAALQANLDDCLRQAGQVAQRQTAAQAALDTLRARWTELWRLTGLEPHSPAEMRFWLGRHEKLREAFLRVRERKETVAQHGAALELAREELLACLPTSESTANRLDSLLDRAQARMDEVTALANRRANLSREIEVIEITNRPTEEKKRRAAQTGLEEWKREWALALEPLGLERIITPGEAESVLGRLEQLFDHLAQAAACRRQIESRDARAASFLREVNGLMKRLNPDPLLASMPPDAAAEQLAHLLARAQLARAERDSLETRQRELSVSRTAASEKARAARELLARFYRIAGCETPEALEAIESRWRQSVALRRSLAELEEQLLNLSAGQSLEALEEETRTLDADTLPTRLEALQEEIKSLDGQIEICVAEVTRAEEQLRRFDGRAEAARAAEDAEALLAQLRERACQYARARLAAAVLRREMERYRLENQSPLVRRAGELFSRLTGGSFAGLCVDQDDAEGERAVLRGVRGGPGGGTSPIEGMSEGTCDQLYLALRLASLEKTLLSQEALPLILDDILVNYDDGRAATVLRVLLDFSAKTQVLLFTHHEHLLALAERELGAESFFVHRFPAR